MAHNPSPISPIRETPEASPAPAAIRRTAMPSGNRSWTEEEEQYLLQTRQQKMPYKHIAAHLNKTELACRLHYHQLFHGSHRRKRSSSVASTLSNGSSPDVRQFRASSEAANPSTPEFHSRARAYSQTPMLQRARSASIVSSAGSRAPKALLPKPLPMTPDESPEPHYHGIRINPIQQSLPPMPMPHPGMNPVDHDRLRMIYENHRQAFWHSIAQEYGKDVSGAALEEVWRGNGPHPATLGQRPLTPPEHYPHGIAAAEYVAQMPMKPLPFPSYYTPTEQKATAYGIPSIQHAPRALAPINEPLHYSSEHLRPVMSRRSTTSSTASERVPINALLTDNKSPIHEQFEARPLVARV